MAADLFNIITNFMFCSTIAIIMMLIVIYFPFFVWNNAGGIFN